MAKGSDELDEEAQAEETREGPDRCSARGAKEATCHCSTRPFPSPSFTPSGAPIGKNGHDGNRGRGDAGVDIKGPTGVSKVVTDLFALESGSLDLSTTLSLFKASKRTKGTRGIEINAEGKLDSTKGGAGSIRAPLFNDSSDAGTDVSTKVKASSELPIGVAVRNVPPVCDCCLSNASSSFSLLCISCKTLSSATASLRLLNPRLSSISSVTRS